MEDNTNRPVGLISDHDSSRLLSTKSGQHFQNLVFSLFKSGEQLGFIFEKKILKILKNKRYNWKNVSREPLLKCKRRLIWKGLLQSVDLFCELSLGISICIFFFTSCLASLSKDEFLLPFTKCLEIRFSIKQVKRKQWHESPCPGNWSQSFHFPLHCWIFNKTGHNICEIQRDQSVWSFYKILNNSFVMSSITTTTEPFSIVKLQNKFPHKTIEI